MIIEIVWSKVEVLHGLAWTNMRSLSGERFVNLRVVEQMSFCEVVLHILFHTLCVQGTLGKLIYLL